MVHATRQHKVPLSMERTVDSIRNLKRIVQHNDLSIGPPQNVSNKFGIKQIVLSAHQVWNQRSSHPDASVDICVPFLSANAVHTRF